MQNYNLIKIGQQIVRNPQEAIEWAKPNGLLPQNHKCRHCRIPMSLRTDQGAGTFRCRRCNRPSHAITEGTWFEGIRSIEMVSKGMLLIYSFALGFSYNQAIRESTLLETKEITSRNTVSDWFSYSRYFYLLSWLYKQNRYHANTSANTDTSSWLGLYLTKSQRFLIWSRFEKNGALVLAHAISYSFSEKPKIKETKGFLSNIKVSFYSEVVTLALDGIYADSVRIGGPGHIIEVD